MVNPFAGMGSIPFEALRIGAEAFAGDLNPVAVLLNKVALEYLPTYGARLAEAVRRWGAWVRERAAAELQPFYPTEPDGSIPLAYVWARTIRCAGPAGGAEVPLVCLLWLSRKGKSMVALRYWGDRATNQVHFEIVHLQGESDIQRPSSAASAPPARSVATRCPTSRCAPSSRPSRAAPAMRASSP